MFSRLNLAKQCFRVPITRTQGPQLVRLSLSPGGKLPVFQRPYASNRRYGPDRYNRFQQRSRISPVNPGTRIAFAVIGGGASIWIVGNIERVPVSGRLRFNCVSEQTEAEIGRMSYKAVMEDYRDHMLSDKDARHKMVGKVLKRLLPNSGLTGDWEYHVIDDDDDVNAFVIPG
ncbi:MAG: hypothetical protein Q9183_004797, partial [Haloplaca sp. 2 TL-2023]